MTTSSVHARSGRPPCPYTKDFMFTAYEHTPTVPTPIDYQGPNPEKELFYEDRRLEAVIQYPAWSSTLHNNNSKSAKVKIKKVLVGGDSLCSRVLVCSVQFGRNVPQDLVAKVFDPLYYQDPPSRPGPSGFEGCTVSLNIRAKREYNQEALTYKHLQTLKEKVKDFVPQYYGSWIFDIDIPPTFMPATLKTTHPSHRSVCMILMEYIESENLMNLTADPNDDYAAIPLLQNGIDKEYVDAAWAGFLEGFVRLEQAGVDHDDINTRNVILHPTPVKNARFDPSSPPRVVIFDFNRSTIMKVSTQKLPKSPIEVFWDKLMTFFRVIWPDGWEDDAARRKWLFEQFAGKRAGEFQSHGYLLKDC